MNTYKDKRRQKGLLIASKEPSQITRFNPLKFEVKSQSSDASYKVVYNKQGWQCDCKDFQIHKQKCKHIFSLEFRGLKKPDPPEHKLPTTIIEEIKDAICPYCGSDKFNKNGIRQNKKRKVQRFTCTDCKKSFTQDNAGFGKLRYSPQIVTLALQTYFGGQSLRNTTKTLKLLGADVSHQTIYGWIQRYTKLIQDYLDEEIIPNVSGTFRADEVFLKVKGIQKYLFIMMDDSSRYWIAQEIADTKYHHDARNLLKKSKLVTQRIPRTFITDGSTVYDRAYRKEFCYSGKIHFTRHVNNIKLSGDMNNNKMERLNGEFRHRERPMRGIKKNDSSMITGYQLYHNYIREHDALNGKTPADACGIVVEGKDKWKTLIENATRKITPKQYSITEFCGEEVRIPVDVDEDGMKFKKC